MELYFHSPNMPSWHGTQLKQRGSIHFGGNWLIWFDRCNSYDKM
jgi:hypothetical protein